MFKFRCVVRTQRVWKMSTHRRRSSSENPPEKYLRHSFPNHRYVHRHTSRAGRAFCQLDVEIRTPQVPELLVVRTLRQVNILLQYSHNKDNSLIRVIYLTGAWPWIALLGYKDPITQQVDYLCGGALISSQYVITAAHCVYNKKDLYATKSANVCLDLRLIDEINIFRYSVRVGEHELQNDMDGNRHQDVLIASRMPHEGFDSVSFQNDIAILKLAARVEFTGKSS